MHTCSASQPMPRVVSRRSPMMRCPTAAMRPSFLGVDMDQLAAPLPLVAHHCRLGLERGELAQTQAAQNDADRRDRHGQLSCDCRAAHPLLPQARDSTDPLSTTPAAGATRTTLTWRLATIRRRPRAALPRLSHCKLTLWPNILH